MLVEVARFTTRVEADLARLLLGDHYIEAVLFDAEMHSFLGVGALLPVRLMALDDDVENARQILIEDGLLPSG